MFLGALNPRHSTAREPQPRLVRRVDHLYARVKDPRALFTTLTERLRLPRSYGFSRVPLLEGGAVSIGDLVFLEALRYAPRHGVTPPGRAGLNGLALESGLALEQAASELSARGLPHSPPYTYTGDPEPFAFAEPLEQAGLRQTHGPLWSMVVVGGLLGERALARGRWLLPRRGDSVAARAAGAITGRIMSHPRLGPPAMARSVGAHPTVWLHDFRAAHMGTARAVATEQLRAARGGALGVERVSEIVLAARDLPRERDRWQRLLDAPADADGRWQLTEGPALRLVESDIDAIEALVCEVASLEAATEMLERERMLGAAQPDEVRLAREALQGLDLRLRESARSSGLPAEHAARAAD